jgi:hypothetical protein
MKKTNEKMSLIVQQQQEAEIAKTQSETLLYQIMPHDIVTRINAGAIQ